MYPYWCIEKGYAGYTGPRDDIPAWCRERAFGWIRVMGVDVINSMVIYTFATIAFYLLGAGVLHGRGVIPQGSRMVQELSVLYTETLGPWSLPLFLLGAFAVLYSTVFSSTAAHCRIFADFVGHAGSLRQEGLRDAPAGHAHFRAHPAAGAVHLLHVLRRAGDDGEDRRLSRRPRCCRSSAFTRSTCDTNACRG